MKDIFEELGNMSDDELLEEMNSILEEVKENETVTDFDAPDFLHDSIFSEIREIEEREAREKLSAEDKRLLEYGRRYKRQLKFRKYWILAAALVLMFAMGITSVGGPQRFFKKVVNNLSGRNQEMVDADSDNIVPPENWDEEAAYEAIEEKYGFYPVRLDYLPDGVVFEGAEIGEKTLGAKLLYSRGEVLSIEIFIRPNYREGSVGLDIEDDLVKEYEILKDEMPVSVRKYLVSETKDTRMSAVFLVEDTYYSLVTYDVAEEDFIQIIDKLVFIHNR